ncbi:MAG: hypothetical protein AAB364_01510 [Patescibacteria group bacterium]
MSKKIDYYEDFLRVIGERDRIIRENKNKQLVFSLIASIISILALAFFSTSSGVSLFLSPVFKSEDPATQELATKVDRLQIDITNIKKLFNNTNVPSFNYLNSKLVSIEQKNEYLYNTILENPDNAITPIILRKEQNNLDQKIEDLRNRVDTTNSWLFGIIATLVVAIILFLGKQILTYFSKEKNSIRE